jgi:hypothetical protein
VFDEKVQRIIYIEGENGARKYPNLEKFMIFDAYFAKVREKMKTE